MDANYWLLSLFLTVPTSYVSFSVRVTSACVHPVQHVIRGEVRGEGHEQLCTPQRGGAGVAFEDCARGRRRSQSGCCCWGVKLAIPMTNVSSAHRHTCVCLNTCLHCYNVAVTALYCSLHSYHP